MKHLIVILIFCFPILGIANNVSISNFEVSNESEISCDISWENSWHYYDSIAPFNHDGIWVFCKGKRLQDAEWEHVMLSSENHTAEAGYELKVANSKTGAILKRAVNGEGNVEVNISLSFNVDDFIDLYSELRLFAIEMVYVEEGQFYVGDSISNNSLTTAGALTPYLVTSENSIEVGQNIGALTSNDGFAPFGDITSDFPKGFGGFYCMKYEISQQQYVNFLNTLNSTQQQSRQINISAQTICFSAEDHIDGERNFIKNIDGKYGCDANNSQSFGDSDDGQNVACNFLNWSHLTAYLDWSGLRPITELEFEKACRGPKESVLLELAWGNQNVINTLQPELTAEADETTLDTIPSNFGIANFGYCLPSGPLRCGFASLNSNKRTTSGASYYGIMEMSGNLWELCVSLSEEGLKFDGQHGNGAIDLDGYTDVLNWDPIIGDASGFRGGGWNSGILTGFRDLAVSDRFFAFLNGNALDRGTTGGRGVISINMFE